MIVGIRILKKDRMLTLIKELYQGIQSIFYLRFSFIHLELCVELNFELNMIYFILLTDL